MTIFDLTNIELYHGWLPDPQDVETYSVLSELSYNQLVEKLVSTPVQSTKTEMNPQKITDMKTEITNANTTHTNTITTNTNTITTNTNTNPFAEPYQSANPFAFPDPNENQSQKSQKPEQIQQQQMEQPKEESEEIKLLRNFLKNTSSQLTVYGLSELHGIVKERQLCVLFRNNHFSTIFKINGHLYTLATDSGFIDESNLVW